jgi:type I restriction enzyme S subunit
VRPPRCARLDEVASFDRAVVTPADIDPETMYVGLENITGDGEIVDARTIGPGGVASAKFRFSESHILYGKLRPNLRKVARPGRGGVCSTDILPVRPGPTLDRGYLHHFLRSSGVVAWATQRCGGANLPRLSPSTLAELAVPVPPLNEQRRIATILDRATAASSQVRAALDAADALAPGEFDSITAGLGSTMPLLRLGDLGDVHGGLQVTSARSTLPLEVPYLRVANVHRNRLDLTEVKLLRVTPREAEVARLRPGDVLVVEGHGNPAEIGRAATWDGSIDGCVHQNHLIRLRADPRLLMSSWAAFAMNASDCRRQLTRLSRTTSGLNTISTSTVRGLTIPVPPLEVQARFGAVVSATQRLRDRFAGVAAEASRLAGALSDRAFRGEL